MASKEKVKIFVEESGSQLAVVKTKTLTKLFKKDELQGHTVDILIQEPGNQKAFVGKYPIQGDGGEPQPGPDKKPVVDAGDDITVIEGAMVTLDGSAHDDGRIVRSEWVGPDFVHDLTPDPNDKTIATFMAPMLPEGMDVRGLIFFFEAEDDKANVVRDSCIVTITKDGGEPKPCPPGHHMEDGHCVPDPIPQPDVIYDSLTMSKLHDGKVRTIKKEGDIGPGGMGVECRASGNPRIVVNADGTWSLVCDSGHGRLYAYVLNYNATLEVTFAFMQSGSDCSQKMRSKHNEDVADPSRNNNDFGGYGVSVNGGWDAKREPFHNNHDQAKSGSLPVDIKLSEFHKTTWTVKDEGGKVRQIGTIDGKEFCNKVDDNPESYMVGEARYMQQSYFWIRQNRTSGTGELRIKRVRVLKA